MFVPTDATTRTTWAPRAVFAAVLVYLAALLAPLFADAAEAREPPGFEPYLTGQVVDSHTRRPLVSVTVTAYLPDYQTPVGSAVTDRRGRFAIDGLDTDELALHFDGSAIHHESGWNSIGNAVVGDTAWSGTMAPGEVGTFDLDRVRPTATICPPRRPAWAFGGTRTCGGSPSVPGRSAHW